MRGSGERNQKPIEQTGKPRSRKAKLEPVSHDTAENIKTPDRLKDLTRSIMENVYIAIPLIDRNHKILMVNNAICKFFRKPVNKFIGQECFREFEKRESVCSHCPGKRAMETGQPAEIETEGIRDNGCHIPVCIQALPTFGPDGAVTGFIEIVEDITERKKAEEALRESEQKYKDLFENAQEAIVTVALDGRITDVNKLVEEYGFKREELFGKRLFDFIPDYDKARSISDFDTLTGGNPVKGEMDVITPKGIATVEYRDNPILRAEEVIGVQIILTDITERKKTEEALRESEQKYKDLFENAREAIVTVDLEGRITNVNKLVEEYGFKREELIGKNHFEFIVEKYRAEAGKGFERLVHGDIVEGEIELITPRGNIIVEYRDNPIVRAGEVIGVQAILTDITDRKKAEQLLRKERDKAQKYLDVAAVIMVAIDSEQRVGLINKNGCQILGYSENEILGKNWFDNFLSETIRDDVREIFNRLLCGQSDGPEYHENPVLAKNGEERLIAWHNTVLRDDKGEVIAALSSGEDITERKKAEEALRESEEKFKGIFEHANDGVIYLDGSGKILDVNQKAVQIFGGSKNQVLNRHFTQLGVFPADEIPILMSNFKMILAGKEAILTVPIKNEKGQEIILECSASVAKTNDQPTKILVIARDVTERKKAEEQITKLAKFPAEDPHPVLRISAFGTVMYGNKAGLPLLKTWRCSVGESLPDRWYRLVLDSLSSGQSEQTKIQCDSRTFSLTFAPVVDANYVNVYGLDITEREQAEQKLLDYQSQLKSLASQLTLAEERERRRIAIELHDRIGQSLAIAKVKLDGMRHSVSPTGSGKVLEEVSSLLVQAIADVRSLTFELSSPILHELGFEAAVAAWLAEEIEQKYGIVTELVVDRKQKPLDDDIRTFLFRDVRELLINVVKHSQATKVKVSIRRVGNQINIGVEDNGIGFIPADVTAKAVRNGGFGLFSIQERLEELGGCLEIMSEPGRGCKIMMKAPLKQKSADQPKNI